MLVVTIVATHSGVKSRATCFKVQELCRPLDRYNLTAVSSVGLSPALRTRHATPLRTDGTVRVLLFTRRSDKLISASVHLCTPVKRRYNGRSLSLTAYRLVLRVMMRHTVLYPLPPHAFMVCGIHFTTQPVA